MQQLVEVRDGAEEKTRIFRALRENMEGKIKVHAAMNKMLTVWLSGERLAPQLRREGGALWMPERAAEASGVASGDGGADSPLAIGTRLAGLEAEIATAYGQIVATVVEWYIK